MTPTPTDAAKAAVELKITDVDVGRRVRYRNGSFGIIDRVSRYDLKPVSTRFEKPDIGGYGWGQSHRADGLCDYNAVNIFDIVELLAAQPAPVETEELCSAAYIRIRDTEETVMTHEVDGSGGLVFVDFDSEGVVGVEVLEVSSVESNPAAAPYQPTPTAPEAAGTDADGIKNTFVVRIHYGSSVSDPPEGAVCLCPECEGHGCTGTDYYGEAMDCHACHSVGWLTLADIAENVRVRQENAGDLQAADGQIAEQKATIAALTATVARLERAVEIALDGAPDDEPTDHRGCGNEDDACMSAVDRWHWDIAKRIRTALADAT